MTNQLFHIKINSKSDDKHKIKLTDLNVCLSYTDHKNKRIQQARSQDHSFMLLISLKQITVISIDSSLINSHLLIFCYKDFSDNIDKNLNDVDSDYNKFNNIKKLKN